MITLVTDFDDRLLRITERSLHRVSAEFEGADDDERLNREQDVEDDECWFHCWGMGDAFRKAMLPVHLAIPAMNAADGGGGRLTTPLVTLETCLSGVLVPASLHRDAINPCVRLSGIELLQSEWLFWREAAI